MSSYKEHTIRETKKFQQTEKGVRTKKKHKTLKIN